MLFHVQLVLLGSKDGEKTPLSMASTDGGAGAETDCDTCRGFFVWTRALCTPQVRFGA